MICLLVATTVKADGLPDVPYLFNWANIADWCQNVGPDIHSKTSRTYHGKPATGPMTDAPRYKNPWNVKLFGVTCCKTPEYRYEKFMKRYQIVQAKHQARLNRLNWDAYEDYVHPKPNSLAGYVGSCDCKGIYQASHWGKGCGKCGKHACSDGCGDACIHEPRAIGGDLLGALKLGKGCKDSCGTCSDCVNGCSDGCSTVEGSCNGCGQCNSCVADAGCDTCVGHRGLLNKIKGSFKKGPCHCAKCTAARHGGYYGPGAYGPGAYGPNGMQYPYGYGAANSYPPMNREDATRYIEGMQYYPPYHLLRSPRDFFMFETKYGIGR